MSKKLLAMMLSTSLIAGLMTGCGSSGADSNSNTASTSASVAESEVQTPEKITVSTVYGDVEVPYAPERICVLDLSTMDIVDALGLGENVVCLQWAKHYPDYLDSYYNSETIISLTSSNNNKGSKANTETEEETDPYEIYYGIDADVIIGTTERIDEDMYTVLSQIAPTVALPTALESEENIYAGMRANAEVIASIWGLDETFETMIAQYDTLYAQIQDAVNGKSFVMANGNTDLSLIQIGTAGKSGGSSQNNSGTSEKSYSYSGKSNKKKNTANISTFLTQLGMTELTDNVSEEASVEKVTAAVEAGTSHEDAAKTTVDAINAVNPDAVFIFNYEYGNLDELQEAGYDLLNLDNLVCPTCFVSIELSYTSGGFNAVTSTMDQIADALVK